jgi:hypothetical protein
MYYRELEFPPIPKELLEDPHECISKQQGDRAHNFGIEQYFKNGKIISPCSYWVTSIRNVKLSYWLRNNIPGIKNQRRFCYQHAYHKTGGCHVVHSDIARNYAINYMIELGGDNAWTSWYQEKGQPEHRDKKFGGGYNASHADYNNLELLDSVKLQKGRWYIMATDVLHDVDKIVGLRKSITINVPKDMDSKVLEKLSCTIKN